MEGTLVQKNTGSLQRIKGKKKRCHYIHAKAQDGLFTQHIKGVNSQLGLACPSHVCVCRYSRWLSCGKPENRCKFVTSLILKNTGFCRIAFPKGNIQQTQNLAFVTAKPHYWTQHKPAWPPQFPSVLESCSGPGGSHGPGAKEGGTGLSPLHKHSETSAKHVLPCLKFAHSLSRNSSNLSKGKTIKPGRWKTTSSEPKVTPRQVQIWKLIHLPAHRHTHLVCLYLSMWTQPPCLVEPLWVFLNQQEIKNHWT